MVTTTATNNTSKSAVGSVNDITKSSSNSPSTTIQGQKEGLNQTFDNFLVMLTTQLRNQDPTQPMDTNTFTQQLVDFAGVEQSVTTNKNLETLIDLTKSSNTSDAIISGSSFIGKKVEAKGDTATLIDGNATFSYTLGDKVATSFIKIKNEQGQVVYAGTGQSKPGKHMFVWNGENATGVEQPKGNYTIEVSALDTTNNALSVTTSVSGIVTGVIAGNGDATVLVGDAQVPIDHITAVYPVTEEDTNS